jgi:hypothetical protein
MDGMDAVLDLRPPPHGQEPPLPKADTGEGRVGSVTPAGLQISQIW